MSLRNMIGRSFATEDAHDKIRAAVIDLLEVVEDEAEANLEQVTLNFLRECLVGYGYSIPRVFYPGYYPIQWFGKFGMTSHPTRRFG